MLNRTFLNEKVGKREIISNEIKITQQITGKGCEDIIEVILNRVRIKSRPSGIRTSPAADGAGTPMK